MKVAILGDIHGNWEALCVVLEDCRNLGVDACACVGDIVGYNPDPGRCLDALRALRCDFVQGNHDYFCTNDEGERDLTPVAAAAVEWTRRQLDDDQVEFLKRLPREATLGAFSIVHAALGDTGDWRYVVSVAGAEETFRHQFSPVCFYGHTHIPMVFEQRECVRLNTYQCLRLAEDARYLINVGSVGQPRDHDPRAAYVIFDTDARQVELRRLPYDIARTQSKIRQAKLPDWLALRLLFGV